MLLIMCSLDCRRECSGCNLCGKDDTCSSCKYLQEEEWCEEENQWEPAFCKLRGGYNTIFYPKHEKTCARYMRK